MWKYEGITRHEFERIKNKVEQYIKELGGKEVNIQLHYEHSSTSYSENNIVKYSSNRPVFELNNEFYRVDEVCFNRPLVVIEAGTYEDVLNNTMEDIAPFPYDLQEEEMKEEVRCSLGLEF